MPKETNFFYTSVKILLRIIALILGLFLIYKLTTGIFIGELTILSGLQGVKKPIIIQDTVALVFAFICFFPPSVWLLIVGIKPTLFLKKEFARIVLLSIGTTLISFLILKLFFI